MNLHVQSLIEALNARGETTTDLLTNLFKGYKAAKDEKFIKYIENQEATMYQIPREDYSLHSIGQENFESKARKELTAELTMTESL
jgi:predicted deacetylase